MIAHTEFSNALAWLEEECIKTQRRMDQGVVLHPHEERQFKLLHCILVLYRMCEEIEDEDCDAPQQGA